jgi:hypothetical protein
MIRNRNRDGFRSFEREGLTAYDHFRFLREHSSIQTRSAQDDLSCLRCGCDDDNNGDDDALKSSCINAEYFTILHIKESVQQCNDK